MRILMYHQVVEGHPPNVHAVSAREFARQMRWLYESGYRSVYVQDCLSEARNGLRGKTVAITFDDGYQDCLTVALPILREQGFVATVFLIAGLMGKGRPWPDGDDFSSPALLTWDQAREATRHGLCFGSHTMTHADLTELPFADVKKELNESRQSIEQETGRPVNVFSYPYGRENTLVRQLVRDSRYDLACTCQVDCVGGPGKDAYQLQRITMLASDTLDDVAAKVNGSLQRRITWYSRLLRSRIRQQITRTSGSTGRQSRAG